MLEVDVVVIDVPRRQWLYMGALVVNFVPLGIRWMSSSYILLLVMVVVIVPSMLVSSVVVVIQVILGWWWWWVIDCPS